MAEETNQLIFQSSILLHFHYNSLDLQECFVLPMVSNFGWEVLSGGSLEFCIACFLKKHFKAIVYVERSLTFITETGMWHI